MKKEIDVIDLLKRIDKKTSIVRKERLQKSGFEKSIIDNVYDSLLNKRYILMWLLDDDLQAVDKGYNIIIDLINQIPKKVEQGILNIYAHITKVYNPF